MKKTDIAMIILIASVSVLVAYFVANSIPFFRDVQKPVKVQVAEPITSKIDDVDTSVFNGDAINPTVEVIIGSEQQPASN
jgi:uncharacterized membrane protein